MKSASDIKKSLKKAKDHLNDGKSSEAVRELRSHILDSDTGIAAFDTLYKDFKFNINNAIRLIGTNSQTKAIKSIEKADKKIDEIRAKIRQMLG